MGLLSLFSKKAPKVPVLPISPLQNLSREYPEDSVTPLRYKHILHDADLGLTMPFMEILDAASTDYKVASVLRTRKLAVAGAPWRCEPGDESDAAKAIAEETEDFLEHMPDFTQFKMDLLDAHYRGFASMRLGYVVNAEGRIMVNEQQPIESRFFRFLNAVEPLILTLDNPQGIPLPPEYLWHVVRDKPGPVTRGGTGRSIGKLWLYKGYNLVDLASYLEKYGMPHVQVKIPQHFVEGSPELERAKSAARSLIADNIGLVPEGVTIELLESIKQVSTVEQTYLAFMRWCDAGIAQAELGHELSSGSASGGSGGLGHRGESDQAGETKQDIKDYDKQGLVGMLQTQLIMPRTLRQYGPTALAPQLCIDVEEPEDETEKATAQKLRAETLAILSKAGLSLSAIQVRQEFDLEEPENNEDSLKAPEPPPVVAPGTPPTKNPLPPG